MWTYSLYYRHCGAQVNLESRSGESAQGESRLGWLMIYARWYEAQSLYTKQRFAKGVQRNITDFLKASITTDIIEIFSITVCTLFTVYLTCKIAKNTLRIVLYVTTFSTQLSAVARFVLNQWFVCSSDVQCCMLLKDSVFVLWINNFKCSLKTSVDLVLATEHLKL